MAARKYNDKRHRERASLHHRSAERWGRRTGRAGGRAAGKRVLSSFQMSGKLSYPVSSRSVASRRVAARHTIAIDRLIASHCVSNEITELSKYLEEGIDTGRSYATRRRSRPRRASSLSSSFAVANDFFLSFRPVLFSVLRGLDAAWEPMNGARPCVTSLVALVHMEGVSAGGGWSAGMCRRSGWPGGW